MSWSITAALSWPVPASTWAALASVDLRCRPGLPEGPWTGAPIELWRDGVSTRAIRFARDGDVLEVKIHAAACPEDLELAIRAVESLVTDTDAIIDIELTGSITRRELRSRFDPEALWELAESGAATMRRFLEQHGQQAGVICVPGPVRGYHIGPRRLAALIAAGSDGAFATRLFDDIRRVQYGPETRGRQDAGLFHAAQPDGKQGPGLAFWTRGHPLIIPGGAASLVIEGGESKEMLVVARDDIPTVAGPLFAGWLDETSAMLDEGDDTIWAAVLARARTGNEGVDSLKTPDGGLSMSPRAPRSKRPWWRFW